jgi:hypothetical protein
MSGRDLFTEGRRFSADDQARVSWRVDPWDDPDEVPVVEVPPRRGLLLRWVVGAIALTLIASVLAAGWTGWWLLELARHRTHERAVSGAGPVGDSAHLEQRAVRFGARLHPGGGDRVQRKIHHQHPDSPLAR